MVQPTHHQQRRTLLVGADRAVHDSRTLPQEKLHQCLWIGESNENLSLPGTCEHGNALVKVCLLPVRLPPLVLGGVDSAGLQQPGRQPVGLQHGAKHPGIADVLSLAPERPVQGGSDVVDLIGVVLLHRHEQSICHPGVAALGRE